MDYNYFFEQVTGAYGVGRVIGRWERRPEDCLLMWSGGMRNVSLGQ